MFFSHWVCTLYSSILYSDVLNRLQVKVQPVWSHSLWFRLRNVMLIYQPQCCSQGTFNVLYNPYLTLIDLVMLWMYVYICYIYLLEPFLSSVLSPSKSFFFFISPDLEKFSSTQCPSALTFQPAATRTVHVISAGQQRREGWRCISSRHYGQLAMNWNVFNQSMHFMNEWMKKKILNPAICLFLL